MCRIFIIIYFLNIGVSYGQNENFQRDTCNCGNFTIIYENYDDDPQLPLTIQYKSTHDKKYKELLIEDLSSVINITFHKFEITCDKDRFTLIYVDNMDGSNNIIKYHVFEKDSVTPEYYWTKTYYSTSNLNYISFGGSFIKKRVNFENYNPNLIEGEQFVDMFYFRGFQDGNEPSSFLSEYYNKVKKYSLLSETDSLVLYSDVLAIEYFISDKYKSIENTDTINNLGYYMEQGKAYKGAINVLENLLKYNPNRTVAYLNLGDAYWGLGKQDKAKETYTTYIEQMKTAGKANKIPKYVVSRLGK